MKAEDYFGKLFPKATPCQRAKALQQIIREGNRELQKKVEEENRKIIRN